MTLSGTHPIALNAPSSEILHDTIEALAEGIAIYDADRRLITFNQRFLDMFHPVADQLKPGLDVASFLRLCAENGVYRDAIGREEEWLEQMIALDIPYDQAVEVTHADGRVYCVRFHPTRSGGFVVTRNDVTEHRRAEQEEREKEELLQAVLQDIPVCVVMARKCDGQIIYRSREAEQAHGSSDDAREFYQSLEDREAYLAELTARRRVDDHRITAVRSDGSTYPASVTGQMVEFKGESYVVSVVTDLSEPLERDALIRHVVESCPTAIQMTNAETGDILFSSPQTLALFGKPDNAKLFYADPETRPKYLKLLQDQGFVTEYKAEYLNANGERFWGAISAKLIRYNGADVIVSHTRDLTEQLRIERELSSQQELLYQNEKMSALGELLAGVAHELNNPLSVVVGHSLMLREEATDPSIIRQTEKISAAAERCARIVKTFLTVARQQPSMTENVDVNEVIQTAVDVTRFGDLGQEIEMQCDLAPNLPPIHADADQITQVIINLMLNAEQAIRDSGIGSRITVRSWHAPETGDLVIELEDNGPGIPAAVRSRIFDPFFTTKDVGQGTGIGLTLCHRIIRSHEGQISLDPDLEQGTRFRIQLPARAVSAPRPSETRRVAASPGRILIIDDEEDVAELNGEILERQGYEVELASSAEDGVQRLRDGSFDLVLSDLNMPDLDGRGLFEVIATEFPPMVSRTAFITGDTLGSVSQSFLKEAARPYLEKPVSPKELRRFVAEMLANAEPI